jgi:hypothetical protein
MRSCIVSSHKPASSSEHMSRTVTAVSSKARLPPNHSSVMYGTENCEVRHDKLSLTPFFYLRCPTLNSLRHIFSNLGTRRFCFVWTDHGRQWPEQPAMFHG